MNRKAVLFLAAIMTAGTAVSAAAAETFADINDVPWGGAQAYINNVYANGLMVGDVNEDGERVFRARENISYSETVQLVYALSGKKTSDEVINKWAQDMKNNNIPRWAYESTAYALEAGIITRSDLSVFVNIDSTARPITRETAAYIFGRFLSEEGVEATAAVVDFADKTSISAVCAQYVDLLSSLDIMVGDENNDFNPNRTINRAEMAVIVTKTNNLLSSMDSEAIHQEKPEPDYSGYINNVTEDSLMLYTFDGKSVILDKGWDGQYYLDGEEISTRGIYSLTSNGIIVRADVYVNSSGIATEIYCTRAEVEGQVTGASVKAGSYKKGSKVNNYNYDTVTITYVNGLSRSYIVENDTDIYYDDEEIDYEELKELIGKTETDDDLYLNIYATADVDYNFEYYVYPQAKIKEMHLYRIELEEAVISYIDNEKIRVLDEDGREYEYRLDDMARFYVDGDKERITDFKKAVRLNFSTVEIKYNNEGYITALYADTQNLTEETE